MSRKQVENEQLNITYCQSVAKSIGEIIKFSLNENFRTQTFRLFRVKSAPPVEKDTLMKLLRLIKRLQNTPKRVEDTPTNVINNSVIEKRRSDSDMSDFTLDSNHSFQYINKWPSNTFTITAYKRSWLKISSERYKKTLKNLCNKKQCLSQPELTTDTLTKETLLPDTSQFHRDKITNLGGKFNSNYFKTKSRSLYEKSHRCFPMSNVTHSCHF